MNDSSHSITDALKEDTLVSSADLQEYQDDLRRAERERLQSGQKRTELLQSLRKSIQTASRKSDERKEFQQEFKRLCRDGYANEIESLITRYNNQLCTLQTKRVISQKTEQIMHTFMERMQVFLEKKKLLQKMEKTLDHFSSAEVEEKLDHQNTISLARMRQVAYKVRNDLDFVMDDLLGYFDTIETNISNDLENEESVRNLFMACLTTLEDQQKRQIIRLSQERTKDGNPYEKRVAFYKNLIEKLVRANRGAARVVHSQTRKTARQYFKQGKYKQAVSELCYALYLYKEEPETYRTLANVFFRQRDEKNAYTALAEVLRLCPEDHSLRKRLADYWYKNGNLKQASNAYEVLVRAFPDHVSYRREWGRILFEQKLFSRVPEALESYVQKQKEDWECVKSLALSYVHLKEWDKAIPSLTHLMENGNPEVSIFQYLAITYRQLELPHEAIQVLQEGIKAQPQSLSLIILLGTIYVELEQWQEALDTLQPVLAKNPKSVSLLLSVSQSLLALNKTNEAIAQLEQARNINPQEFQVHLLLARAHRKKHHNEEAQAAYEHALALQKDNSALLEEMAAFYAEQGLWEKATEIITKLKNKKS